MKDGLMPLLERSVDKLLYINWQNQHITNNYVINEQEITFHCYPSLKRRIRFLCRVSTDDDDCFVFRDP